MGWPPLNGPPRRAARLAGAGIVAVALAVAAGFLLVPLAARGFVRALGLTLNACVWLAASIGNGADAWTIAGTVARAAGRSLLSTQALAVVGLLVLVGAASLYGLQRLLGSEEESSR